MYINQTIRRYRKKLDYYLWYRDKESLPRWRRYWVRTLQIGFAIARDLAEGQLSLRAMSLVYYTVIAFIPLLALSFAVLKGLGAHNYMEPALLSLLEPLGERGEEATENIIGFVENVRVDVLSFVSLGVLLFTVLNMMQRIEMSFNFIWCVEQGRSLSDRISEYLFAIIVSPLLIVLSVSITSYVNTRFFERFLESVSFGSALLQVTGFVAPFLFMSFAFALIYVFVPNTRVDFRSAFIGGVATTAIWKLMGSVFQSFFAASSTNAIIYVAFFTVILIMLFVYLGWLVLLVGSSIAFYHQNPGKARLGHRRTELSISQQEEIALTLAYLIIQRFKLGMEPWTANELTNHLRLSGPVVEYTLNRLCQMGFLKLTNDEPPAYMPAASVENCTLLGFRQQLRDYSGHVLIQPRVHSDQLQIRQFQEEMETLLDERLGDRRFIDLLQSRPAEAKTQPEGHI